MATLHWLKGGLEGATAAISSDLIGALPALYFLDPAQAIPAPQAGLSAVYAFGDSLSDAGNDWIATLHTVPAAPYDDGRFTNGQVWVQDLSQSLGLPPVKPSLAGGTDFAFGGAETGPTPVHQTNPTDLPGQIAQYLADVHAPQPNALYTVWIGSNDVVDIAGDTALTAPQQQDAVRAAVTNEANFIGGLAANGARDFVVMNVPDLGKTPYEAARGAEQVASASALSAQYDADLASAVSAMVASGAVRVELVDTYSLLDGVIADPAAYGFTNVTQPVWNGSLTDPSSGTLAATGAQNGYLFFDGLHPTAHAHALLAQAVTQGVGAIV
jgi:phospholipase/lecithinase/hemolysin